uniref:Uncharacterized protein n=1 Tax=Ditylenchus dipsaci TaxID=166011 RepID=A0A915ERJ7_9BILA
MTVATAFFKCSVHWAERVGFASCCSCYIRQPVLALYLGNKLLQALNHEEAASKKLVFSKSTTTAPIKHAQLTSETTKSSTGYSSIKYCPKKHRNRHSHRHRQQRPRKNKNAQSKPKEGELNVAELRHDQHSLAGDSGEKIISQTNLILPNIKVTSTELRKLYATHEKAATKDGVVPYLVPHVIEHRQEHLVTLVTALLDIGRETWPHYGRSLPNTMFLCKMSCKFDCLWWYLLTNDR